MHSERTSALFDGDWKTCSDCGVTKLLTDFWKERRIGDGRQGRCIACRYLRRKAQYEANREKAIAYQREWKRRNPHKVSEYGRRFRHGLEPADYRAMLDAQDGRCAICGRDDEKLKVDHCHTGGHIRGLLCDRCNRGIGFFFDSPDVLRRAAAYVEGGDAK